MPSDLPPQLQSPEGAVARTATALRNPYGVELTSGVESLDLDNRAALRAFLVHIVSVLVQGEGSEHGTLKVRLAEGLCLQANVSLRPSLGFLFLHRTSPFRYALNSDKPENLKRHRIIRLT